MDSRISYKYLTGEKKFDPESAQNAALVCAREGAVLLINKNGALPLNKGGKVAFFGRMQKHYLVSGTGSGGRVHAPFITNIFDSLKALGVTLDEATEKFYEDFVAANPYDVAGGWTHPASQAEPLLEEEFVRSASGRCETALFVITRTAGEDRDLKPGRGEYMLSQTELDDLTLVRRHFKKLVVLLNVSGIIDFSEIVSVSPDSLLVLWNGGMMGGRAAAELLTGIVSPSGKLPDTAAVRRESYPACGNFGATGRNIYAEDIYVGYRYFSTFARDEVIFPFGFGLSYTNFEISAASFVNDGTRVVIELDVRNAGNSAGKEAVQCYVSQPQGRLGKPERVLAAFCKTKLLSPGEAQRVRMTVECGDIASYDDENCVWILEKGEYVFRIGDSLNDILTAGIFTLENDMIVKECESALAPVVPFERLVNNRGEKAYSPVPTRKTRAEAIPAELKTNRTEPVYFDDVADGKASLSDFVAGLSDEELCCIVKGEGMSSPKVTPGTAAAFVGVTKALRSRGLPVLCCTDGPSGIRMVSDAKCTSFPSATCLAAGFDPESVENAYKYCGAELASYCVDILLGPGTNIHRDPLCGRNFEYFSEDPLLAGRMAAAVCRGLDSAGVSGCVKHFMANNQECDRHGADSVMSERAVREIYSKPFAICAHESGVRSLMTSYNPVNGNWAASNYELVTRVLRNDIGFEGVVMTDWWARVDDGSGSFCTTLLSGMVHAGNDVYMVTSDSAAHEDDLRESLANGTLKRSELQACAYRLCAFALDSLSYRAQRSGYGVRDLRAECAGKTPEKVVEAADGRAVYVSPSARRAVVKINYKSVTSALTQTDILLRVNDKNAGSLTVGGTGGEVREDYREFSLAAGENRLRFKSPSPDVCVISAEIY